MDGTDLRYYIFSASVPEVFVVGIRKISKHAFSKTLYAFGMKYKKIVISDSFWSS